MRDIDIIPLKEASKLCGVSEETLELLNKKGKLEYKKHPYGEYKICFRRQLEKFYGVPKNSFLPHPSEEELINGARMCYENSSSLLKDAKLLYSQSKFGSSFSICALSLEELSKSIICLDPIAKVGRESFSWEKFWKNFFSHSIKIERIHLYMLMGAVLSGYSVKGQFKEIRKFSWYIDAQKQNGFYVDYIKNSDKAWFESPDKMVDKSAAEEVINFAQVAVETIGKQELFSDKSIKNIRTMTLNMLIKRMSTPELKKLIINLSKALI